MDPTISPIRGFSSPRKKAGDESFSVLMREVYRINILSLLRDPFRDDEILMLFSSRWNSPAKLQTTECRNFDRGRKFLTFILDIFPHSSKLSLCLPTGGAATIICYNFSYLLMPQRDTNPPQSVELHQTVTFEGHSTN